MIDMSAVISTHGIGYLTLIISFQLLEYKDRDKKVCQSSAFASFTLPSHGTKYLKFYCVVIFMCCKLVENIISQFLTLHENKNIIDFSKNLNIFMLGRSSHHLIHVGLKHHSEILCEII